MSVPYDQIVIINLAKRADRRTEMQRELARVGLGSDTRVRFFAAVEASHPGRWNSNGEHGCFMSHFAVVQHAARLGESLLLLEDDCDFTAAALRSRWGLNSDIFYGGYWVPDFANPCAGPVQGAHCMGFSSRAISLLGPFFEQILARDAAPPPADGLYVDFRKQHRDLVTEFARPQIAVQRQSASDISPGRFDRSPVLAPFLRMARAFNRGRYRRQKMMEGVDDRS